MVTAYLALLGLIAAERLVELGISSRNAAWARRRGGEEHGARHFRALSILHTVFLGACAAEVLWLERPFFPALGYPMLAAVVVAQALRYWAIAALGRQWNVRVIVVPDAPAVARGPYAYVRHPNYLAVIIEGVAIPLVHSAWLTAAGFTVLNALVLTVRIRCEERALRESSDYQERLGRRPRFLPAGTGVDKR